VTQRGAPAVDYVPAALHGELVVAVTCCYAGPADEGEEVVRPLKAFGSPALEHGRRIVSPITSVADVSPD
jgi:hypothetical protein